MRPIASGVSCGGLATSVQPAASARRRPDAPADSPAFLRIVADDLDTEADFLFRVWDRLPLLPGQEFGDGRQTLDNQIGGAMQDAGPRVGVRRGPARQRALGRCDCGVDIGAVGKRGRADAFASRWIVNREPATAMSRPRAPVDEEIALSRMASCSSARLQAGELVRSFDGRSVTYGFGELDAPVPAYAATIHKSQGAEYPAVIIPVLTQHYAMLQRNLLYTGVTRGKRLLVLVGQKKAIAIAVRNVSGRRRWSKLDEWLRRGASRAAPTATVAN